MAEKGARRRQRILEVVEDLASTTSFDDISIAEITRRAEVTRPGFYFYFPSKGAAVATLMEGLFQQFMDAASRWYDHAGDDQRETLRQGMDDTVAIWRTHAHVMHCIAQAADRDEHARPIWDRWLATFTARAVPTLAEDTRGLLVSTAVEPEHLAGALVNLTFDTMRRDVRSIVEDGRPLAQVSETLTLVWSSVLYAHRS